MVSREPASSNAAKRIVTSRRAVVVCLVLAVLLAGVLAFRGLGRWLIRQDPLAPADAVVVLSGSLPFRAEGAADIYRQHYAPEVWVTRPASAARELAAMGIHFIDDEEYNREVLIHEGVPPSAIRILPEEIVDTEQELEEVSLAMLDGHKTVVIIVTSPEHTRRVRALWNRLARPDQKSIVRAAAEDPFDGNHWWRNTRDAYAVVRELLGLLNAWAGLPVRPRALPGGTKPSP
jgi:uncharacterized SAM-binding protein YcdF (DUF218 family)